MGYDKMRIAVFLKEMRQKSMYTQGEVADAVGITVQTYGKYENGLREPSIEVLYKLACFFKISPILFFVSDYPLQGEDLKDNMYSILSITSANFEKYKWLLKRYLEKAPYAYSFNFDGSGYVKRDEKEIMKIKSSLFRIFGDLDSIKRNLIKLTDEIEVETKDLIEELDKYS